MKPPGVPAAPNRCQIKAKVLSKQPSADRSDKWMLEIEIVESQSLEGPNFARVGEQAKAFSFETAVPQLADGSMISAEGEYLGGPTSGQFQLTRVALD